MQYDLIRKNMVDNHRRALITITVVDVLIMFASLLTIATGKASPGFTYSTVAIASVITLTIIGLTWLTISKVASLPWSKYLMVTSLFVIMLICRSLSPQFETVSLFYIIIILSMLYLDLRLTLLTCAMCVVLDIGLIHFMPSLKPVSSALSIRYFSFIFASVAAGMGSYATHKLLLLAADKEQESSQLHQKLKEEANFVAGQSEGLSKASRELIALSDNGRAAFYEIEKGIEDTAKTATVQAGETDRVSRVIGEMLKALNNIGQNLNVINEQFADFMTKVEQGRETMSAQGVSLQNTVTANNELSSSVDRLEKQSGEIELIVATISGIAEETSLLALNAAIEAARAGEQGRGFAVVAEEVRKLADESAESARNIASIISDVQKSTRETVAKIQDSASALTQQVSNTDQSARIFRAIDESSSTINSSIHEISSVIQQLIASSEQISNSMHQISAGSQHLAATSEEVTAITLEQTSSLTRMMDDIKALDSLSEELKRSASSMVQQ